MENINKLVPKPWGREVIFAHTDKYVGKLLYIKKGHQLSLQFHNIKDETMLVVEGTGQITMEEGIQNYSPGKSYWIPPKTIHRIKAQTPTTIVEVSTPELDDVVRIEDNYGRR